MRYSYTGVATIACHGPAYYKLHEGDAYIL